MSSTTRRAPANRWALLSLLLANLVPVAGVLVSHGASFVTDYLASGKYRRVGVNDLMLQPYGRVVVLHLTIIVGAFLAMLVGPSQLVLLLFVVIKISVDVWAQLRVGKTSRPAEA